MKSFLSLAIAVLLINVQGSPLNEVLEDDYGLNNHRDYTSIGGRDAIIAGPIQDELHDTEALDRRERKETSVICLKLFCNICQNVYCLHLMYLPMDNNFFVSMIYFHTELNREIIQAKNWDKCIQLKIFQHVSKACVRIENVIIKNGHACVDLTISSVFLTNSFSNLCM